MPTPKTKPKVSIVIPVYNGSNYLREAIESALAQTYTNIEIIVVNDGSNDEGQTEKIAQSYKNKIRYFSKPNGGVASALNFGITQMKGSYFSWLSHDDLYYPNKIEEQINFLKELKKDKAILYSNFETFSVDPSDTEPCNLSYIPPEKFRYWITTANHMHGCTLLIPKLAFDECGVFKENLKTTQDYDLWFRFSRMYSFHHLPRVLVKARIHPAQDTHSLSDIRVKECDKLLGKFITSMKTPELILAAKQAPETIYTNLSQNMKERGFKKAHEIAEKLKHAHQKNLLQNANLIKREYAAFRDATAALNIECASLAHDLVLAKREATTLCAEKKALLNEMILLNKQWEADYNRLRHFPLVSPIVFVAKLFIKFQQCFRKNGEGKRTEEA